MIDPTVTIDDFDSTEDRLLLFGYTLERDTFAVAIRRGRISRTIFAWNATPVWIPQDQWHVNDLYPLKRVYPEDADASFIRLLRSKGASPTILPWDEQRAERVADGTQPYTWEVRK